MKKYRIDESECLKCGLCVSGCPEGAIEAGDIIRIGPAQITTVDWVRVNPELCTGCGTCVSQEYWCPAEAFVEYED